MDGNTGTIDGAGLALFGILFGGSYRTSLPSLCTASQSMTERASRLRSWSTGLNDGEMADFARPSALVVLSLALVL